MIGFKRFLKEAFDKPYSWSYNSSTMEYSFESKHGLEYNVSLSDEYGIQTIDGKNGYRVFEFKFWYSGSSSSQSPTVQMSSKNDPQVFATIVSILKDVTSKPYIDIVDISGSSDKRSALYIKMAQSMVPKLGLPFRTVSDQKKGSVFLVRKTVKNISDKELTAKRPE